MLAGIVRKPKLTPAETIFNAETEISCLADGYPAPTYEGIGHRNGNTFHEYDVAINMTKCESRNHLSCSILMELNVLRNAISFPLCNEMESLWKRY